MSEATVIEIRRRSLFGWYWKAHLPGGRVIVGGSPCLTKNVAIMEAKSDVKAELGEADVDIRVLEWVR